MPNLPIIEGLTKDDLLRLEAEYCRASLREVCWKYAAEKKTAGAFGSLVDHFLEKRNQLSGVRPRLDQKQLLEHVLASDLGMKDISYQGFNHFLNGNPARNDEDRWYPIARESLKCILGGTSTTHLEEEVQKISTRMLEFFFPRRDRAPDRGLWFFSEELMKTYTPVTVWEVAGELRSLAHAAKNGKATCRITRVSGWSHFTQLAEDLVTLGPTGEPTLECLDAGVQVTYVYPQLPEHVAPTLAEKSARAFRDIAQHRLPEKALKNLRLRRINPRAFKTGSGSPRWAGAYLCPIIWWAYYERSDTPKHTTLILARPSSEGTKIACMERREREDFEAWAREFVG